MPGLPAAVMGDPIMGTCPLHLIPNPITALPQPGPPVPFNAPVTIGVAVKTMIGGRPAVVAGATGLNTPPHVGLHPADPSFLPPAQIGTIVMGSTTVLIEGRPAAMTGATCTICEGMPGTITGSAATVLIGA